MNTPIVSVIVTTYKGKDVIKNAIESVLKQTYKSIELIVVDDNGKGSEEQVATEAIVSNYKEVKYIPHEININGSAARNTGIRNAKGEYIALLDDDDVYLPDKIEKQYNAITMSNAKVCYCGQRLVFSNGYKREYVPQYEGYIHDLVLKRIVEAPSSVLFFEKDAAIKIGGFDESFRRHQDWEFLDRLSEHNKIAAVKEIGIVRNIEERNMPKDAKTFESLRLYYLDKMSYLINKLNDKDKKDVYYFHYKEILKMCVKVKDWKGAIKYAIKAGRPICLLKETTREYVNYRKRL